jgi:hypothetical protein
MVEGSLTMIVLFSLSVMVPSPLSVKRKLITRGDNFTTGNTGLFSRRFLISFNRLKTVGFFTMIPPFFDIIFFYFIAGVGFEPTVRLSDVHGYGCPYKRNFHIFS